jgi:hypothetical protein
MANFRGEGDEENMTLGPINGETGRKKPSELLTHFDGLISTSPQPTKELVPRSKPKDLISSTPTTQDLLKDLVATTQVTTPKATRPNTPESGGSKSSRTTVGGKAPRVQVPTKPYGDKNIELTSEEDESGEDESEEDEIQSSQPATSSSSQPPLKLGKPKGALVQTNLLGGLGSSKKQKLNHVSTTDDADATTLKFSSSNMQLEQVNKIVEQLFIEREAQKAAEEENAPKKKGGKKGSGQKTDIHPKFDKAGKPSSAASTEQKGRPLFMKSPYMFL